MYHIANDFTEGISETVILEMEESDLYMCSFNSPGPDDEDEEESEDEVSSENSNVEDNDPPIDNDVVHSPVPPKTGGRGK